MVVIYFEFKDFYIEAIENEDLGDIVNLYNSNKHFLKSHIGRESINIKWVSDELDTMEDAGFDSYKIVQKRLNQIVGLVDFKLDKQTYLSLLVIDGNLRNRGIGTRVYQLFEEYAKWHNSTSLRIDVVTGYDKDVLDFWTKMGFKSVGNIRLAWDGNVLPAVTMIKYI